MQSLLQYRRISGQVSRQLSHANLDADVERTIQSVSDKGVETARSLSGITVRSRSAQEDGDGLVFIVGWDGAQDVEDPHNWSIARRLVALFTITLTAVSVTATSSVEAALTPQASHAFHVSEVAGSLTTGASLIGFGIGSLFAGSFSETLGRNFVYMGSLTVYMLFIMASALAPNFAAMITFRFLSGFFGCTPLTAAGGTIADIFSPLEAAWAFPLLSVLAFGGPLLGPVIAAYIGQSALSFHWAEWLMLIMAGVILALVILYQPETYAPLLLKWKAYHFRRLTGDSRYMSDLDMESTSIWSRLGKNMIRPFVFVYTEPIVLTFSIYLALVYVILFTFFSGYEYIFTRTYNISQGLTNLLWLAVLVGVMLMGPLIPLVYKWTKRELEAQAKGHINSPEIRLWYAMLGGSIAIPISLFWIGWTCFPSVSLWVPLTGTVLFGYGLVTIFTSAYMYIIDVYLIHAASALSFNAFIRYIIAGGLMSAGIPMYQTLNPHWNLTMLGFLGLVMAPVPYVLFKYGPWLRQKSKNVVNR